MITCPACRAREMEGELYCSECGARQAVPRADQGPTI
jgi:hypothetical protein